LHPLTRLSTRPAGSREGGKQGGREGGREGGKGRRLTSCMSFMLSCTPSHVWPLDSVIGRRAGSHQEGERSERSAGWLVGGKREGGGEGGREGGRGGRVSLVLTFSSDPRPRPPLSFLPPHHKQKQRNTPPTLPPPSPLFLPWSTSSCAVP
jgi:hypothetical protein